VEQGGKGKGRNIYYQPLFTEKRGKKERGADGKKRPWSAHFVNWERAVLSQILKRRAKKDPR